ncbi:MAG: metalloregulator ArsR/SmtB family transcription factor [Fibrobacteria bacterium]
MAFSKKTEFSGRDRKVADFAKALSHPARVAILRTLAKKGTCICGEIVEVLPLAQSTVSQHLKDLREAGIIKGEVSGLTSCYCIDWDAMEEAWETFSAIFGEMRKNQAKNCC